jgi:hypothetical protein
LLAFLYGHLLAEFFGVACGKSSYRCVVDAAELAARIVIIEHIVCRMFFVVPLTVSAAYDVYAIPIAIKKCINI